MFSSAFTPAPTRHRNMANAYQQVGLQTDVSTASPHRLVAMLLEGCLEAIAQARGAIRAGQIELKGRAIGRAARIVEEGLRATLDMRDGGSLAVDLHDLYSYLTLRLTQANVRNDDALLDECQRLLTPLRDAWNDIGPRVANPATATALR
jgi:flagellar protein FliS